MVEELHDSELSEDAGSYDAPGLQELLDFLQQSRGFDFAGYKRPSLTRRIRRRMDLVRIRTFGEYLEHLRRSPEEFPHLFNLLLVNVTAFFRDPPVWEALAARLPFLVDEEGVETLRVWSAGCSSGEEAYTLAMMLHDVLGAETFERVKIYATDVDDDALEHARRASYSSKAMEPVPGRLLEKYFVREGESFTITRDLRRAVHFGRHDLTRNAPIPRVSLLTCRNALMYFNADTQKRILRRLQFALTPTGVMLLGKAEMLLTHAELFAPLDFKLRLFTRTAQPRRASTPKPRESDALMLDCAFDASPFPQIALDASDHVVLVNHRASRLLGLIASDLGRSFHELDLAVRPTDLRACVERARLDGLGVRLRQVEVGSSNGSSNGSSSMFDIDITRLVSDSGAFLGVLVTFVDATPHARLRGELRHMQAELEATRVQVLSAQEDLESTSLELHATVDKLETTNAALESTNEELESTNEELQSTNEELQTINEELRGRTRELNELGGLHAAILDVIPSGVAVLDNDLRVTQWNGRLSEVWGACGADAIGRRLFDLDIGVSMESMAASLRDCLATGRSDRALMCATSGRFDLTLVRLGSEQSKGVLVLVEEAG